MTDYTAARAHRAPMTPEETRRANATLAASIRLARISAEYSQDPATRAGARARLAELEAIEPYRADDNAPELCEGCDAPAAWTYDEYGPELRADAERRGAMVAPATAWCDACHDAATDADPEAWTPLPSWGDRGPQTAAEYDDYPDRAQYGPVTSDEDNFGGTDGAHDWSEAEQKLADYLERTAAAAERLS